jgi:glutamate synthase (NADPH/NADH) small chain
MTRALHAEPGSRRIAQVEVVRVELDGGKISPVAGTERFIPCDLLLLAMGFVGPERAAWTDELGLALDSRGNVASDAAGCTSVPGFFAAGDVSRGQSLVVWAIADGRRVARGVDAHLRMAARAEPARGLVTGLRIDDNGAMPLDPPRTKTVP